MKTKPVHLGTIKTGNPFAFIAILTDNNNEAIEITSNMSVSSRIINQNNGTIAICEIEVLDQAAQKGGVQVNVSPDITATWRKGIATGDLRLEVDGVPKNSMNYTFEIEKSIT